MVVKRPQISPVECLKNDRNICAHVLHDVFDGHRVFIFTGIRLKEIYLTSSAASVDGEEHRHPPFDNGSVVLRNSQRNLTNLFEFPVLFYTVCFSIFVTNTGDAYFVQLAYWYFYLRTIHSFYHIFFNHLAINGGFPMRAIIWIPSTAVLVWMWIRFITLI